jgi:hypothetical protein
MSIDDPLVFHVAVPEDLRQDLIDGIGVAAEQAGNADYTMSIVDSDEVASELQFDPLAAALVVAKFVVLTGAARFIGDGLAALVKKIRADRPTSVARVIVLLPDGSAETLDLGDEKATAAIIERVRAAGI